MGEDWDVPPENKEKFDEFCKKTFVQPGQSKMPGRLKHDIEPHSGDHYAINMKVHVHFDTSHNERKRALTGVCFQYCFDLLAIINFV